MFNFFELFISLGIRKDMTTCADLKPARETSYHDGSSTVSTVAPDITI
jgi:hypothetical protein